MKEVKKREWKIEKERRRWWRRENDGKKERDRITEWQRIRERRWRRENDRNEGKKNNRMREIRRGDKVTSVE